MSDPTCTQMIQAAHECEADHGKGWHCVQTVDRTVSTLDEVCKIHKSGGSWHCKCRPHDPPSPVQHSKPTPIAPLAIGYLILAIIVARGIYKMRTQKRQKRRTELENNRKMVDLLERRLVALAHGQAYAQKLAAPDTYSPEDHTRAIAREYSPIREEAAQSVARMVDAPILGWLARLLYYTPECAAEVPAASDYARCQEAAVSYMRTHRKEIVNALKK